MVLYINYDYINYILLNIANIVVSTIELNARTLINR